MSVTVPLFDAAAGPDQWHHVTAPGGYEWWHVAAYDAAADLLLSVHVFDGFPFDPVYRRRYAAYRRRPTHHAPPQPRDFPRACVTIVGRGRILVHDCQARPIAADPKSAAAGAWRFDNVPLLANLTFGGPPATMSVSGSIALPAGAQTFSGVGYREHDFSTSPPAAGRRIRLRIIEPRRILMRHEDGAVVEYDTSGTRKLPDEILSMGRLRRSAPGYPDVVRFGGHELNQPAILTQGREYVELVYRSVSAMAIVQIVDVR
ncbi:MAG TPA: hypothetical protein VMD30_11545 [Tepidisphaeraceae bacterium]|nr:hypothetical protein [Tepidisphaeraceae bacterium]